MAPIIRLSTLFALLTLVGACETTEGFGRDVQSAGSALERESNEAQARRQTRQAQPRY